MRLATETDTLIETCARALAEYNFELAGFDVEDVADEQLSGSAIDEEREQVKVVLRAAGVEIPAD